MTKNALAFGFALAALGFIGPAANAKAFPGTNLAVVRQGLLASAKAGAPHTGVIPGVGDAAIYDSTDPIRSG